MPAERHTPVATFRAAFLTLLEKIRVKKQKVCDSSLKLVDDFLLSLLRCGVL
jgi:hypothetical protein